jgi:hypothetical protein
VATSTSLLGSLHAVKLRHENDGFTSPPKESVLRIFLPEALLIIDGFIVMKFVIKQREGSRELYKFTIKYNSSPSYYVVTCGNGYVDSIIRNLGACLKTLARLASRPLIPVEKASCTSRLSGPQRQFGILGVERNR